MYTSTILASVLLSTLTAALPAQLPAQPPAQTRSNCNGDECFLLNFYLVTTSSCEDAAESKLLPDVSAISLFDPSYQSTQILRTIGSGYNSLPTFNITGGQLHTLTTPAHGPNLYEFNSTKITAGSQLGFVQDVASDGQWQLQIIHGYLLNVAGSEEPGEGWTLCDGPFGETVIYYKGTDASCKPTYIQAYTSPPY